MDPAVASSRFVKAGAISPNENPILLRRPPADAEGADHDDLQNCRSPSIAASLHLHSSIDAGQVPFNQESTERQYNLANKASRWAGSGTDPVLDRDLGQSRRQKRQMRGLKHWSSDVAMGQVGAIFPWKPRAWRARTRTGIACSSCAPSPAAGMTRTAVTTQQSSTTALCSA